MQLILPNDVKQQLIFLIAEVRSQLQNLRLLLDSPSGVLARAITERSGHSYNLRQRTHIRCLRAFRDFACDPHSLRAAGDIADELEHITSLCRDAARELEQLKYRKLLQQHRFDKRIKQIEKTLILLNQVLETSDAHHALRIGKQKSKLSRFYKHTRKAHLQELKHHQHTEALISSLFVARFILDMGSALTNISEALLAVLLGQPMNLKQFLSLRAMINSLGHSEWDNLSLETIAETRSGSSISAINHEDDRKLGVLKEGAIRKVQEERRGLEQWNAIFPGIAPQILSQHNKGRSGALIIEHLPGKTLEHLVLMKQCHDLQQALTQMCKMLPKIWESTLQKKAVSANFIQQLSKRLPAVFNIHPQFAQEIEQHGKLAPLPLPWVLEQAERIDALHPAPFSVYIHGDFNLDNILYDHQEGQLRFIDLHRSGQMDYVQDISVFMVSGLRLPLFDDESFAIISDMCRQIYQMAESFAVRQNDQHFQLRMTLGLARSLITSTRFILDEKQANTLYQKGIFLLDYLLQHHQNKDYQLPLKDVLND